MTRIIVWDSGHFFPLLTSHSLQKLDDFEFYGVFSCGERQKKFFAEQSLVNFKKVWFYYDDVSSDHNTIDLDFLRKIEDEYGLNLWRIAINERIFNPQYNHYYKFSKNQILSILEDECRLYDRILNEVKPEFLLTAEPALHNQQLFYLMCRAKNVKVLMLNQSPLGYNCLITEVLHKLDDFEQIIPKTNPRDFHELREYLKKFDKLRQISDQMNSFLTGKTQLLKAVLNYIFISNNSSLKENYSYYGRNKFKVVIKEIFTIFKKNYRKRFIDNNLIRSIGNIGPFVYLPLQLEPESVNLIGAPFNTNQLETVRHILKSLPVDYHLIVKEHPIQSRHAWRPISYYKEIMDMPNVHLAHPDFSNTELLEKTSLVITAGGTSGFEAGLYGRPAIIFADLGYAELPSVFRVESMEKLPEVIRTALNHKIESGFIESYVEMLEKNSFDFDLFGFITSYHDLFYYSGFLGDTEIKSDKMKLLMDKYEDVFDRISENYLDKIKYHLTS